jgi:hypothetical protein
LQNISDVSANTDKIDYINITDIKGNTKRFKLQNNLVNYDDPKIIVSNNNLLLQIQSLGASISDNINIMK